MPTATKTTDAKPKLSIAELSALYDRVYDIADRLLKKHNPCNIHKGRGKNKNLLFCKSHKNKYGGFKQLCCSGCDNSPEIGKSHWSKSGCTVKALACKLYLCPDIRNRKLQKRFVTLREYSYSIVDKYYVSKEDCFTLMEKVNGKKRTL